ncbi:MAG TPA: AAA family ATPase [Thermoplasmata archaeon]|nr:AAA family ATPase [Thermoplasmata archaeon]
MARAVALTGTPGTGKSAVARALGARVRSIEVADLARSLGAAQRRGRATIVDLPALRRRLRRGRSLAAYDVVVGHLAHLLPIDEAIVLRCHPTELGRRLARARRGTPAERRDNVVCEATDRVLIEAVAAGRTVFEIDTTGRSVAQVARAVRARLRRPGAARTGTVDWLADAAVTEHLLDRSR